MGFKDLAMNLVTLGWHERLEAAKSDYEIAYREYACDREKLDALEALRKSRLEDLGELVLKGFKIAKISRRMLRHAGRLHLAPRCHPALPFTRADQKINLASIDNVIAEFASSRAVIGGAGAGTAAAVGSWSLVALVGSASTGTAISTLSGVAATNATLAWFGGGALAAGGTGMAGGTLVLGGVALVPVIAVATWHSRSKTKEVNLETDKVRQASFQVRQAINPAQEALNLVEECLGAVQPSAEALQWELEAAKLQLFPTKAWSLCRRWLGRSVGRPFYSDDERATLHDLEAALMEFISCFQGSRNAQAD